jgi:acyl carrier protein
MIIYENLEDKFMIDEKKIKECIRNFTVKNSRENEISDNDDIFQKGFVTSLFAMQLVMFVEKEFNIKVSNDDLNLDNFNTINNLECYVKSKLELK